MLSARRVHGRAKGVSQIDELEVIEPVKYVDWAEQVLKGLVDAVAADPAARTDQQAATELVTEALRDAVRDLERLGLASRRGHWIELT